MDNGSVKKNISRIRKASGISQAEMAGYNWAKVSYTGEQDGVTWYNELYIAYTPSHIYCVCCAAPQDDFAGLRPTFSQVLDTIQVTPVS